VLGRAYLTDRFTAAGGVRADCSERYRPVWVPQARLRYDLTEHTLATLSASRGFKTPSIAQQFLPFFSGDRTVLQPEHMWQYEIGLSHQRVRWSAEVAAFLAEGTNLIRLAMPGWPPIYDNSGSFVHRGIETTLRGDLGGHLGGTIAAAWMIDRDAQTLATPAASYRGDFWYRVARSLRLSAGFEAEFDRYGNDERQDPLDDLLLLSAGAAWSLPWTFGGATPVGSEAFVTVRNLTDESYRVFTGYPMPGRTWSMGVRFSR